MKKLGFITIALLCAFYAMAQPSKDIKDLSITNQDAYQEIQPSQIYDATRAQRSKSTFYPLTNLDFVMPKAKEANGLKAKAMDNGVAIHITGRALHNGRSGATMSDQAKDFMYSARDIMGIQQPDAEFSLVSETKDDLGMTHLKYHQVYKGVKVYGAEVVLFGKNEVTELMGRYQATPELEVTPSITAEQAMTIAKQHVGAKKASFKDQLGLFKLPNTNELVIYKNQLAYHLQVFANVLDRHEIFVDAHNGEVINTYRSGCKFHNHSSEEEHHNCAHHAHHEVRNKKVEAAPEQIMGDQIANAVDLLGVTRQIHTYEELGTSYMIDISRDEMFNTASNLPNEPQGVIWTIDAFNSSPENDNFSYDHVKSNNNTWGSAPEAVSSQYNGGLAYNYFLEKYGRISINGQKGNIISFVNVSDKFGNSMDNAFWNGYAMFYGNGGGSFRPLARGLDVAGHEMTHGVVQNTANLEYFGESGALNESFADVFGAMIDRDDWQIGEDVVLSSAFPSGALRSLSDPNQGQPTNSFNTGWQPKHMNQKFNGPEDNNGVHINSGIPNHAFFRFAQAVGKNKAETVYFRALEKYLVKSSKFIDARLAVIKAAEDLNLSSSEVQAARDAWAAVGVGDGQGTTTQTDVEVNPGDNLIMYTNEASQTVSIMNTEGNVIAQDISSAGVRSRFSITDDGTAALFVNSDNQIHAVLIDWSGSQPQFQTGTLNIPNNQNILQVAVSRKGERLAYTTSPRNNKIFVFNFEDGNTYQYELYNPTFSQGNDRTYDVDFADALEFDYSGNNLMYDAKNTINGLSGTLEYYDIGIMNIWNAETNSSTAGNVSKLFNGLPENVSIGNPTFAKNSEYIIAFDYAEFNQSTNSFENFSVLGANLESGDVNQIKSNNTFGFPSYATSDGALIYTKSFSGNNQFDIVGVNLNDNKISASSDEIQVKTQARRAAWFSNGERILSNTVEVDGAQLSIQLTPNPVTNTATLQIDGDYTGVVKYFITDTQGRQISSNTIQIDAGGLDQNIDLTDLASGQYILSVQVKDQLASTQFVKL